MNQSSFTAADLKPHDWKFYNEGNANIVLQYIGPRDSRFSNKVLRLGKQVQNAKAILNFHECMIRELFGPEYIVKGELVEVTSEFLVMIDEQITPFRRTDRLGKGVCKDQKYALLLHDVTSFRTVTVEIKPKWGFLDPYSGKCRYCAHQLLKLSKKTVSSKSSFCPRMLFSKDEIRIKESIKCLVKTPQNNLRIVKKGFLWLDRDIDTKTLEALTAILSKDPILSKLKLAQKAFHDDVFELNRMLDEVDMNEYFQKVDVLVETNTKDILRMDYKKESDDLIYRMARFIMSLSLKDISLMISFDPDDTIMTHRIFILDCDLKPARKIHTVLALEIELKEHNPDCSVELFSELLSPKV